MKRKEKISQYRRRLDKTLTSEDLASEDTLKALVKNQILQSSQGAIEEYIDSVVEKRTKEVVKTLDLLKSASIADDQGSRPKETQHGGWKIKQDTDEYRVMYREGPEGTPFHTLLVEGYIDGPIDVCLCIGWESALYKKWWPQSTIPTFKVVASECLQKVRISEQISLVRMKVSWPLSAREVVVHYFAFEYFQDDLVIVLLNSISDLESIEKSTHGFTKEGIPDAQDVVRMDLVGGFALQKVTPDSSYFRTIANMDIKLDFVPPSFINFVARQLVGSGFKLYQKEVASVSKGDEDFREALKDPFYTRIREALFSNNKQVAAPEPEDLKDDGFILLEENLSTTMQIAEENNKDVMNVPSNKDLCEIEEIEEEEIEESRHLEEDGKKIDIPPNNGISEKRRVNDKKVIRPEVEQALGTLEKVISIFRENGISPQTKVEFINLGKSEPKDSKSSEDFQVCLNGGVCVENSRIEDAEKSSNAPRNSSGSHASRCAEPNSYSREGTHNRIAPEEASPEDLPNPSEALHNSLPSSQNEATTLDKTTCDKLVSSVANGTHVIKPSKPKNKKLRYWCLNFISGQ